MTTGVNLTVLRPLRFIRLMRTLRILRVMKFFLKLRVLVSTVAASFMAIFWSIFLLVLVMLISALFMNQLLAGVHDDPNIEPATLASIFNRYGTPARSMYTVFEFTFSGGW